ncbi:hypothetical protein FACS1894211_06090 [Clostridia bacterium]|nr:hypothetical protein FACS1894211_06090 [Clostridia bacterium]
MKKIALCLLSLLLFLPLFTACGTKDGGGTTNPPEGDKEPVYDMLTLEKIEEMTVGGAGAPGVYGADTFDRYLSPVWHSQLIYNENAFVVRNQGGTVSPLGLAFPAAKIVRVVRANALGGAAFTEGTDYTLGGGKLTVPDGSNLPIMPYNEYFPPAGSHSDAWYYKHPDGTGTEVIGTNDATKNYMLSVTYIRTAAWDGEKPVSGLSKLTTLEAKQEGTLNVLFIGDSLIEGAGPVHVPPYAQIVAEGLAHYTGRTAKQITAGAHQIQDGAVNWYNGGVGGIATGQYNYILDNKPDSMPSAGDYTKNKAKQVTAAVLSMLNEADLIIVGLGTNDGGGWDSGTGANPTQYRLRMESLLDKIRAVNPDASLLLVSPPRTNDNVYTDAEMKTPLFGANAAQYEAQLKALLPDYPNAALAPLYAVEQTVLKNKTIDQLMGDGRNHPGDFMTRLFAQTVLTAALKPGTLKVYPQDL